MNPSVTRVKLFGPGIPTALKRLEDLTREIRALSTLREKISFGRPYLGEKADYEFFWTDTATKEDILLLAHSLDQVLSQPDCRAKYSLVTYTPLRSEEADDLLASKSAGIAYTFFEIHGPWLAQALEILEGQIHAFPGVKATTGALVGHYDFAIEWLQIPTIADILNLLQEIDSLILETGITYQIATISPLKTRSDDSPAKIAQAERTITMLDTPPSITIETV
ncbi:MAG: hypothetical protein ACFFFG_07810 [Candidatus Thorarchaeota archaeon]